jgi:hypothetical protein
MLVLLDLCDRLIERPWLFSRCFGFIVFANRFEIFKFFEERFIFLDT